MAVGESPSPAQYCGLRGGAPGSESCGGAQGAVEVVRGLRAGRAGAAGLCGQRANSAGAVRRLPQREDAEGERSPPAGEPTPGAEAPGHWMPSKSFNSAHNPWHRSAQRTPVWPPPPGMGGA